MPAQMHALGFIFLCVKVMKATDLLPVNPYSTLLAMSVTRLKRTDMPQQLTTAFTRLDDVA